MGTCGEAREPRPGESPLDSCDRRPYDREMTIFYLLPGSEGNASVWAGVASRLASHGDSGIPLDLCLDGGRSVIPGLHSQAEIVEAALSARPDRSILVGYSYSGLVAAAVVRRAVAPVAGLIYVDAIVPEIASSASELLSLVPPVVRRLLGSDVSELYGTRRPPRVPTAYVRCTARPRKLLYAAIEASAVRARELEWTYAELATGHRPMVEAPDALVARLRAT